MHLINKYHGLCSIVCITIFIDNNFKSVLTIVTSEHTDCFLHLLDFSFELELNAHPEVTSILR